MWAGGGVTDKFKVNVSTDLEDDGVVSAIIVVRDPLEREIALVVGREIIHEGVEVV